MSNQLQITGAAKIRTIQGPVVANSGVITALDGDATQYVRGDGTLADFPTSTGGGSSVSYYLNTSISQGTIGGVAYKQLSKVPISGAGTDVSISANGYIASYLTDANDPALLEVPAGNFNCEFYFSVNSNVHNPYVYAEVYKYDGTTFTLLGSNVSIPQYLSNGTTLSPYYFAIAVSTAVLTVTDRIAIRIYVNVDTRTVTLHTENNHLCQVVTTFSKGLISLNNLTRQNQFFATGTSGTDFNISSVTATHTFNIPDASASARGLITTGIQTIAGSKTFSSAITADSGITLKEGVIPSAVGYTGLAGDADGLVITKRVSSTAYTNLLYFNSATSNTYTFPNASGTIALTSNLSSYVPYTGATGAVNLGAFDLTVNGVNVGKGAGSGLTYNTRVGALNFMSNTTGAYNSSFGYESLNANTTGLSNTAIGFGSLSINTTGNYNTAIGSATMQLNITGSNNTAVGYGALGYNLGSNNIAVGSTALVNNTTGSNNTAIGPQAGSQITTGANNTLVGGFIGSPTISNNIILSDGAGNIRYRWDGTNNVFGNPISATSAVFSSSLVASVLQSTSGIILSTTVQVTPSSPSIAICGTPTGLEYRTSANVNSLIFQAANYTYTFPAATGTLALTSNITSAISGTTNYHAKFTGTNTIGNSLIWDNGTNVGIGNTNTSYTLDVSGSGRYNGSYAGHLLNVQNTNASYYSSTDYYDNAGTEKLIVGYGNASTGNALASKAIIYGTSGVGLNFYTNGSTTAKMVIDTSGNVGIGTSSPTNKLQIGTMTVPYSGNEFAIGNGTVDYAIDVSATSVDMYSSAAMSFATSTTERMRITSGGIVDIAGPLVIRGVLPADQTDAAVIDHNSNTMRIFSYGASGVTGDFQFRTAAGGAGSNLVSTINGTTGVYVAVSNINRKKDFEESTIGLNEILSLKPTLYRMKDDNELANKELGFIAQEVKEFIPYAYVETGEDDNKFIGLNYNPIVAALVKAIQEQNQLITSLQDRLDKAGL